MCPPQSAERQNGYPGRSCLPQPGQSARTATTRPRTDGFMTTCSKSASAARSARPLLPPPPNLISQLVSRWRLLDYADSRRGLRAPHEPRGRTYTS
ncbi:hypothetical protein EVAR_22956_1 [Eumeta japonica]|uniref:Uncharacterized protein n=1 Tax=Eumeta variegata TaxID=151549 RepID=A0A4C1UPV1_EUMVA|nr:hypothetical protein EVAR_22956_1 [Eumeta japonica]